MPLKALSSARLRAAGLDPGRFFAWWRTELDGAWRDWSARQGRRGRILITVDELELSRQRPSGFVTLARAPRPADADLATPIRALLGSHGSELRHLEIVVPADAVLHREVYLPFAVGRRLREAVSFQLDRLMPLKSDLVYFGCAVSGRDEQRRRLRVSIVEVRRVFADALMDSVSASGIRQVSLVSIGATPEQPTIKLIDRSAARVRSTLPAMDRRLGWSAAILALAVITSGAARYHQENAELSARVTALKVQAATADTLRETLQQRVSRIQFLAGRVNGPDSGSILAELTRLLPNDAWVFQLQAEGDQLHIAGFAKDASALSAQLSKSSMFASVSLRSAVKAPGAEDERFDIAIQLHVTPRS